MELNPEINIVPETREKLSAQITEIITNINFGINIKVIPVSGLEIVDQLNDAKIGLDNRAKTETDNKTESVFNGLDFDSNKTRVQAFALYDINLSEQIPVGVITIVIEPQKILNEERYFERTDLGIVMRDYSDLIMSTTNEKITPNFIVMPAWTKVDQRYLGKFAIPGFRAIKNIIEVLETEAPLNTYFEMEAQGMANNATKAYFHNIISEFKPGKEILFDDIITNTGMTNFKEILGQNTRGSDSTIKAARLLGAKQANNYCGTSLGPVFIKKLK